jgi:hypothetical protein
MRRRNIPKSQYDAIISRLLMEGRIAPLNKKKSTKPEARVVAGQPSPTPVSAKKEAPPPSKLDGPAAYDEAAYWLAKWGVNVTWQRFKGEDVPEIDGRLTHVGELVERYFDERRKWAASSLSELSCRTAGLAMADWRA